MAATHDGENVGTRKSEDTSDFEKFYIEELEVPNAKGRLVKYDRLLHLGFVLSVVAIVTGVALHIAEYSMRADPNGKAWILYD